MLTYVLCMFIFLNSAIFMIYLYVLIYKLYDCLNKIIYINTLIPVIPATLYAIILIEYLFKNTINLEYYFIEWTITTSLLVLSILFFKTPKIYYYYLLVTICVLMNISGYICFQYHLIDSSLQYILFSVSSFFYSSIIGGLYYIYTISDNTLENSNQYVTLNNNILYKNLLLVTAVSWLGYPIIFLFYILNYIDIKYSAIGFMILDFLSKTIFTSITLSYELFKNNHSCIVFPRIIRVYPIEFPSNEAEPGIADYTLTDIPNISDTV
jgi:hypothetical protein